MVKDPDMMINLNNGFEFHSEKLEYVYSESEEKRGMKSVRIELEKAVEQERPSGGGDYFEWIPYVPEPYRPT